MTPEQQAREIIEAKYGAAYDTKELQRDFTVKSFLAPFVMVERKSDGKSGTMEFTHMPRFYFNFIAD